MTDFNVLVGADPELFVMKDGKFVSGHGMIGGTKNDPHKVDKGAVQVDGHALEFNIDPAASEEEFVSNLHAVMGQLRAMVPTCTLHAVPVAKFGKEYLQSMPDEANELGCEPDYNAWEDGEANPRPNGDVDFRTGGGHVHIGWTTGMDITDEGHVEAAQMLTRQLDYFLGLASMFWDDEEGRRAMYGKAGAYRVKPYGVEYRSLSNAWLSDDRIMQFVYRTTVLAARLLFQGIALDQTFTDLARTAIDTNNKDLAKDLIEIGIQDLPGCDNFFESIPCKKGE